MKTEDFKEIESAISERAIAFAKKLNDIGLECTITIVNSDVDEEGNKTIGVINTGCMCADTAFLCGKSNAMQHVHESDEQGVKNMTIQAAYVDGFIDGVNENDKEEDNDKKLPVWKRVVIATIVLVFLLLVISAVQVFNTILMRALPTWGYAAYCFVILAIAATFIYKRIHKK